MERSLLLLLDLLRATTQVYGGAARPALVLAVSEPAQLLAEFAPPDLVAVIGGLLREITHGQLRVEQSIPQLRDCAAKLEQVIAREPSLADQLHMLGQQLQMLDTINRAAAGESSVLTQVGIHLAETELAALVREWHISASATEPAIVVVCTPPELPADHSLRLRGSHYVERRVTFHYQVQAAHPRLSLRSLSATVFDDTPQAQRDWWQLPATDYDLTIFTEQERFKGRIFTRRLPTPLMVHGDVFTLTLAGSSGSHILSTELRDERDTPLTRVLHWPPIDPA